MRLINADAFKEWVDKYYDCTDLGEIVRSWIDERPTVEAEPVRRGKWFGTVCSACGESDCEYYDHDYCPNCGARMEEVV